MNFLLFSFILCMTMILKIFSFFQSPRGGFKGSSHHRIFYSSTASLTQANNDFVPEEVRFQSNTSIISWYPGHIAKAEKELSEYLKKVDVVIEVRDARIPYATTHPMVPTWVGNKPLIVAIARLDQISRAALADWRTYYTMNPAHPTKPDAKVFFIDGKLGAGVSALKREALKAGISVNERRMRRGIQPRPVRAAVIGFPNVGKSALINRLLGKRLAKSQNLPGVTRQLQWIRIGGGLNSNNPENALELLDSPGIIPARQFDQEAAIKLAICNDIGEASYDRVVIAGEMCNRLNALYKTNPKYVKMQHICDRYKVPFDELTGDEIVYEIANKMYHDNIISAADRLLSDFRKDVLFFGSLEAPIFNKKLLEEKDAIVQKLVEQQQLEILQNKGKKSNKKTKKGKKSVLDVDDDDNDDGDDGNAGGEDENSPNVSPLDVGKGNYEGW